MKSDSPARPNPRTANMSKGLSELANSKAHKPRRRQRTKQPPPTIQISKIASYNPSMTSQHEERFAAQLRLMRLPVALREYRFAALHVGVGKGLRERLAEYSLSDWRFDFAWPDYRVALEIEGGIWIAGRHSRGAGYLADCRKYNAAQLLGWQVFRATGEMVKSGEALQAIKTAIEQRPALPLTTIE